MKPANPNRNERRGSSAAGERMMRTTGVRPRSGRPAVASVDCEQATTPPSPSPSAGSSTSLAGSHHLRRRRRVRGAVLFALVAAASLFLSSPSLKTAVVTKLYPPLRQRAQYVGFLVLGSSLSLRLAASRALGTRLDTRWVDMLTQLKQQSTNAHGWDA